MTDTLSRNIYISMGGHALILLMIFLRAFLVPSEAIDIRNAIRVDVVGLPEKMSEPELLPLPKATAQPEPTKLPPKLPPKEAVKESKMKPLGPSVPSPKAKKADLDKQKQALNKIKSLEALEKIKSQVTEETDKPKKGTVVKGNQVNEGNKLTGLEKIEYDRYFDELEKKVRGQWNIPQWLADAKYKAQVQVLIDERGYVIKKIFRRSSNNVVFDNSVTAAIDSSSPLPPPPKRLKGLLETTGVIFNFPE